MRERISNAALRRQIVRHARHQRRGRYGPCPHVVRDDEGQPRVILGEDVPFVFGGLLPSGLAILTPYEMSVCGIGPGFTWKDAMRSKLTRGELDLMSRIEVSDALERGRLQHEKDELDCEIREEARRLFSGRVSSPVRTDLGGRR